MLMGSYLQTFVHLLLVILTFLVLQFLFGKKASFPYGILVGIPLLDIGILVILSDFSLIFPARLIVSHSLHIKWLTLLQKKLFINEDKLERSWWLKFFQNFGRLGVVVAVSTPFAGGVWTGAVLGYALGLKDVESIILIALGAVIGCAVFVLAFWVSFPAGADIGSILQGVLAHF